MATFLHSHADWICAAQARGTLYALDGYPGLIADEGQGWVQGDLFSLSPGIFDATIAALDDYEECTARFPEPHEYRRRQIQVRRLDFPDQEAFVAAWTYLYAWPTAHLRRITTGDWLA